MTEPMEQREPDDGLGEKLDALEEKVLGERMNQTRDERETESEPAFEQDADAQRGIEDSSGSEPP